MGASDCLHNLVKLCLCLCFAPSLVSATGGGDCQHKLYTGFDSRVKARVMGRLEPGRESIVGFDVVRGTPVVALPHRLVLFHKRRANLFVEDEVQGVISDSAGNLLVQVKDTDRSDHSIVKQLGPHGFAVDSKLTADVRGTLHGSGTKLFLEAISDETQTTLLARRRDGAYTVMTNLKGELRTVSWNKSGLAAVASNTALIWPTGSTDVSTLAADKGLEHARDICLVGSDRAILTLNDSVLVLTHENATVLVGMQARCAWDGKALYLLDERTGLIWWVSGAEQLGTSVGDLVYAQQLVQTLSPADPSDNPMALEAARLVGCNEVMKMRAMASASPVPPWEAAVSALLDLAAQLMEEKRYDEAADAYKRVLWTNKDNPKAKAGFEKVQRAQLAERAVTVEHAKQLMDDGKYNDATDAYKRVLRDDKNNVEAKLGLEKVQRAEAAEREIAVRKDTIEPTVEHAKQLMDEGKYDEAADAYKRLLQTNKANAEAKTGLQEVQRAQAAERDISVRQQTVRPAIEHAKQLMNEGKYDEAAEDYKHLLRTNKANAEAKAGLEEVQRAQAAEREIANARTTTFNAAPPTLAHAKQLMDEGQYDEAAATYRRILQTNKDNLKAKAGLERVQRAQAAERELATVRTTPEQRSMNNSTRERSDPGDYASTRSAIPPPSPAISRPLTQYWWCEGYYTTGMEPNGNRTAHTETHYVITYIFGQTVDIATPIDVSRKFKEWMNARVRGYDYASSDCHAAYSEDTAERGRQIGLNTKPNNLEQIRWSPGYEYDPTHQTQALPNSRPVPSYPPTPKPLPPAPTTPNCGGAVCTVH
jgi:tetratricopeptide (TPR) repeat protein